VKCDIIELDISSYENSIRFQDDILKKRQNSQINDTIIFTQHYPVITIGRKGSLQGILATDAQLNKIAVKVINTDRGGDVTYHGPGQVIAWPIFDLNQIGRDLHKYMRMLEDTVILLLKEQSIFPKRINNLTGVWVQDEKIASLGIGVKKWVSYHGISLNVNTSLEHLAMVLPCGLKDRSSTTISKILGEDVDIARVKNVWQDKFKEVFGLEFGKLEKIPSLDKKDDP